jgi:hypothetical protein
VKQRRGKGSAGSPGFVFVNSAPTDTVEERQRAFRTYVEPEIEVLLRVARTVTGSWADAEDLVQDTLMLACRRDGCRPTWHAWPTAATCRSDVPDGSRTTR